uniref:Uncharacterized protein n=1 Tax=Bursaphelenchus xylophilus TaxID=6326 RepID=A0A1I7RRJ2_BURXY
MIGSRMDTMERGSGQKRRTTSLRKPNGMRKTQRQRRPTRERWNWEGRTATAVRKRGKQGRPGGALGCCGILPFIIRQPEAAVEEIESTFRAEVTLGIVMAKGLSQEMHRELSKGISECTCGRRSESAYLQIEVASSFMGKLDLLSYIDGHIYGVQKLSSEVVLFLVSSLKYKSF